MSKIVCTGYENRGICSMCGGPLGKRRRAYCSESCYHLYLNLFFWPWASYEAISRAHHKCQLCGITSDGTRQIHPRDYTRMGLRVHHIVPLDGSFRTWNKLNIPGNLLVVCHDCHVLLHTPSKLKEIERRAMQPALI